MHDGVIILPEVSSFRKPDCHHTNIDFVLEPEIEVALVHEFGGD